MPSRRVFLSTKHSFTMCLICINICHRKGMNLQPFLPSYPFLVTLKFAPGLLLPVSFSTLGKIFLQKCIKMIADICQTHSDDVSQFELLLSS